MPSKTLIIKKLRELIIILCTTITIYHETHLEEHLVTFVQEKCTLLCHVALMLHFLIIGSITTSG